MLIAFYGNSCAINFCEQVTLQFNFAIRNFHSDKNRHFDLYNVDFEARLVILLFLINLPEQRSLRLLF